MEERYLYIWFRHSTTDWLTRHRPTLKDTPVVLSASEGNRKIVTTANNLALTQGICAGMVVADARILVPNLQVIDDQPELAAKLLHQVAIWAIRYTPAVAIDLRDGIILNISGCAHLWGGERPYFREIIQKLTSIGYDVRGAIADTVGAAWAWARFGSRTPIIESGQQQVALNPLSPAALRLDGEALIKLRKVGIRNIGHIVNQPRHSLLPRFGKELLLRLDQALGFEKEIIKLVRPVEPYQERLPCLEPIRTHTGIEIALTRLLEMLCHRLKMEGKGLRSAVFTGHRVDGALQQVSIGTTRASNNITHLFRLFAEKIPEMEPDLGFEIFVLEAPKIEDHSPLQESLWGGACTVDSPDIAELLDRLTNKAGADIIHRYLPAQHHWPDRSIRLAASLEEKPGIAWPQAHPRPIHLLNRPERIEVTAPVPDYPPMNFQYKGKLHIIQKADGPERIEEEWWIQGVRHRDYYVVEDKEGGRYWLFRSGHYIDGQVAQWYLHGFF